MNDRTVHPKPSPDGERPPIKLARPIAVHAINGANEWGPGDHCRVMVELAVP
jgi:hypothetical protein